MWGPTTVTLGSAAAPGPAARHLRRRRPPDSSLRRRTSCEALVRTSRSGSGGLEELDRVAGGIVEQDLLPAWAGDDVVAERQPRGAEPFDFAGEVLDDQMDAVPAAGLWCAPVGHRPSGRAGGAAQQQPEVAPGHVGERGGEARAQLKTEVGGVEGDGGFDVVDHVT